MFSGCETQKIRQGRRFTPSIFGDVTLEAGATSVFDKGCCHDSWWTAIARAGVRDAAQVQKAIVLLTNDMNRPAAAVATHYKGRWQIELLFRWIKPHLSIRRSWAAIPGPSACRSSRP